MLMDPRPSGRTASDDNDNDGDDSNGGRGEQANELVPAKDHVKEASSSERGSRTIRDEGQQSATTTTTKNVSGSRAARGRGELEVSAVTFSSAASPDREKRTNRDSSAGRAPVAAPRAQLAHTKSVSGSSGSAAHDWQPVAPPRARKRQSVPFARVPSELVARHNAVLAGVGVGAASSGAAPAELAGSRVEEGASLAAAETSSASHPAPGAPVVCGAETDEGATKRTQERDVREAAAAATKVFGRVVAAEIDSSCSAPQAESPISSGEPQASASSVSQLLAPKTFSSSCSPTAPAASATDHQSAPSAGSGAGSTISSIFTKIMGKSQSSPLSLAHGFRKNHELKSLNASERAN